jgi:periplasmic protein TonB
MFRLVYPLSIALAITLALFLLMAWMIRAPKGTGSARAPDIDNVRMVEVEEEKPDEELPPQPTLAAMPSAPSSLATPVLPALTQMSALPLDATVSVPVNMSGSGFSLGSGAFSGFGRGAGAAGGGGQGQGFVGKELIPLSTARPQIPEWAFKRGIEGWVECVFTVMPNGHVRDVKIVDANPKGVFEAAAVESISNWIYAEYPKARQVKQKVEFKLSDFQFNWQ